MSDQATIRLTVLWEQELRETAKAAYALHMLMGKKDPTDDEAAAIGNAIKRLHDAALVALHGLWDTPDSHVIVCNTDRMKYVPRDIKVVRPRKSKATANPATETEA